MKRFWSIGFALVGLGLAGVAVAGSLGNVADGLLQPIKEFSNVFNLVCYVIGAAFLVGTLVQWVEHRRNPMQVRLSQVVFLFLLGVILVLLPYLTSFSQSVRSVGAVQRHAGGGRTY